MELDHDEENMNFSISRYERMLRSNTVGFFDSNEFENIIHYYLESGKINKAKRAIQIGLSQHPSSIGLKLLEIETLIFEDRLDRADALLNQLHAIEPENEEIFIQKANIYSKKSQHKKAIWTLRAALDIANDEADLYSLIGMEYLYMDDFEHAKSSFMRCLEYDDADYSSLYNLMYCFDFLEQHQEAIDFLNLFLDKNPYSEVAWHQVGKQYYDLKEYEKALAAFDFAIISDDTFIGAYLEKGKVLERLKRYQEAIEVYMITTEIDDPTSFAYLRIGKCYEKLGAKDQALQYYSMTVREDPLLDKGWIAITDYYYKKKNYQKALYYINKALAIDSENVFYWKRYARINNKLNFFEEAERGFDRALELGNYELETWLQRADVLRKIGEQEAAIQCLYQAIEFYPDHSEIESRLAILYFDTSNYEKGGYHLENTLKIDKEYMFILQDLLGNHFAHSRVQTVIRQFQRR